MPKNTLIVVVALALIATLVVGINIGRSVQTMDANTPVPTRPAEPQISYTSGQSCGVTFTYPDSFEKLESTASGLILSDLTNPENSVVFICQPEIPRVPLPPEKIEDLEIPTSSGSAFTAALYHDASQKDGTPVDKVIFTHPGTGLDVYIAGFGEAYTKLIHTLRLP